MRLRTLASGATLALVLALNGSGPLLAATTSVGEGSTQAAVAQPTAAQASGPVGRLGPVGSSGSAAQPGCGAGTADGCDSQIVVPPKVTPTATPLPPTATPTPRPLPPTATPTPKPQPPTATPTPRQLAPTVTPTPRPLSPSATATPKPLPPTAQPRLTQPLPVVVEPVDEIVQPSPTATAEPTATPTATPQAADELVPSPDPSPAGPSLESLAGGAGLQIAVLIEPPEALTSLAPIGQDELRGLLDSTLRRAAPELGGLVPASGELSWLTGQDVPAGARLAWPRRLALRDGIYLDLARSSLLYSGGPGPAPRVLALVLTPAYRLEVLSAQGEAFGSGIYRHGTVVSAGLRNGAARPATLFGLLGGAYHLLGWEGLDSAGPSLELTVTGPGVLQAKWQEDTALPAALGTAVALLTLLFRPVLFDWSSINLMRKLPWRNGSF